MHQQQQQQSSDYSARSPSSVNSCSSSGSFPETVPGSPSATESSDRYKTELCRSFEEGGTCRYGNKCRFAHGRSELRSLDRHPKYKTELCRTYHSTGFCPYGQRCHFIHGDRGSPRLDGGPSDESPGVVPTRNGCDERTDERSTFGEERGILASYGQFQGFQPRERRLKAIGEAREGGLEEKLECLRQKLDAEKRMRFFEIERKRGAMTVDELKERFHRSSYSSSSSRLEPNLLELELSAILQRRRSQLRCNSTGSGCETPPPAFLAAAALDSRTSSPLSSSAEDTRSPMLLAGSPPYSSFLLQDVISLPRSPLRHHPDYFLRNNSNRRAAAAVAAAAAATVSNISKHKDSLPSPLWSRSDGHNPSHSVSGLDSPGRLQDLHASSSSGLYFAFDAETLARLMIRR